MLRVLLASLLGAALLVGVPLVTAGPAAACSCVALAPESLVETADLVIVGTPQRIVDEGSALVAEVDVARSYKQQVPAQVTVYPAAQSAACGVTITPGQEQLLVLDRDDELPDAWRASLCRNLNVDEDLVRTVAGPELTPSAVNTPKPQIRSAPSDAGHAWWTFGGLVVIVVVGALVIVWTTRRRN